MMSVKSWQLFLCNNFTEAYYILHKTNRKNISSPKELTVTYLSAAVDDMGHPCCK